MDHTNHHDHHHQEISSRKESDKDSSVLRRGPIQDEAMFRQFGCDILAMSPPTPDRVDPDVVFERDMYMGLEISMPDGKRVTMWVFYDPRDPARMTFPSEMIRVRQGQIVHTRLSGFHHHTIHHHGIEGTPFNDGVGHTSFLVDREYTYQWFASQAGSYLYHCHMNTVLHFEMGMYGLLIVDPPEGRGRVFSGGPAYDVEGFWVADEIDPRWHELDEHAGMGCPFTREDPGLNRFEPKYFVISGAPHPLTRKDPRVAVNAKAGETILIRVANAGYTIQEFTIEGLEAEIVAMDGRPLTGRYAEPVFLAPGAPLELTTAQRRDIILRPKSPGSFPVTVKFRDWISREILGSAETFINVRTV
jgi:FtsP/CotA-like multicopper oxidase with cupredoxin domain